MNTPTAFDWQASKSQLRSMFADDTPEDMYPQRAYYWRKKAGLTGTRQEPDRGWRERKEVSQGDKA
jgi:hypothetical protein